MNFESGSSFMDKVKQVVHEGNVRHVVVEKGGRRVVDLPLTLIIIGAVLAPWIVAILAVVSLLLEYRISIENRETLESSGADLHSALDSGKDAADSAAEKVTDVVDSAADRVADATDTAADKVKSVTDTTADKVKSATGTAAESAKSVTDAAAESAKSAADKADDAISR